MHTYSDQDTFLSFFYLLGYFLHQVKLGLLPTFHEIHSRAIFEQPQINLFTGRHMKDNF